MDMAIYDAQPEQTSSNISSKWKANPNTEDLTLQIITTDAHWSNAVKERDYAVDDGKWLA